MGLILKYFIVILIRNVFLIFKKDTKINDSKKKVSRNSSYF